MRAHRNTRIDYSCDFCGKIVHIRKNKVIERQNGKRKYICCSTECAKNIQKPKGSDIVDLFNEKDYKLVSTEYLNAKHKLEYICSKHSDKGLQTITYGNLKNGYGCKYCGIEKTANARRNDFEKIKQTFALHDMILLPQEYQNSQQLLKYICQHHQNMGIQKMSYANAISNYCPYCNFSKGEKAIQKWLQDNNIAFETQKKYGDLLGIKGHKLSYDFYLPDLNMLIEYQGQYHDGTVPIQTPQAFENQKEHDKRKSNYAKSHGIQLLEIWYHDFSRIPEILQKQLIA